MRLTAAVVLSVPLLVIAVVLTTIAATGNLMPGDRTIAEAIQGTPWARFFEPIADTIAGRNVEYPLAVGAALYALLRRDYLLAACVIVALSLISLNTPLKELIERPRPSPDQLTIREQAGGFGYPSGHVWGATLMYGYVVAVAVRQCAPRIAMVVTAFAAAVIAGVAWERVYVGAHWPSDTLGSVAICGFVVCVIVFATARLSLLGAPIGAIEASDEPAPSITR